MDSRAPRASSLASLACGLALVLLLGLGARAVPAAAPAAPPFRTDSVLVAFKPQAPLAARTGVVQRFALKAVAAEQNPYFARLVIPPAPGIQSAEAQTARVKQYLAALRQDPSVRVAEPNYLRRASALPNDPRVGDLWGLHNTGQTGGTADADIDASEAWNRTTGSDSVVVAVIDTGVDHNHPDLKDNILRDGSGKVIGRDFVNNDDNPMDDNEHGTHVAGTIGARGNNGIGVVGVSQRVKIMPLKFLDADGSGDDADAILAIDFARQNGARILNNSWGGGGRNQLLLEAIRRAEQDGILVLAAAGNGGWDGIGDDNDQVEQYPANFTKDVGNMLSVAASDHRDRLGGFSNYGRTTVDLAAPGVDILSTTPGNTYGRMDGTSMATPHVAGAAALVLARNPALTVSQLKARLMDTVDPVAVLESKTVSGGRLNVDRAIGASDDQTAPGVPTGFTASHRARTGLLLSWTASGDDGGTGTAAAYDLRYSTAAITAANFDQATRATLLPDPAAAGAVQTYLLAGLSAGTSYHLALRAIDDGGNSSGLALAGPATTLSAAESVDALVDNVEGAAQFTGSGSWAASTEQSVSPTRAYSDSPGTSYANNTDTSLTQNASVRLTGMVPVLQFQARTATEAGYDFFRVEVSDDDGSTWRELLNLSGTNSWSQRTLGLARFYGQDVRVRFRLESDDSLTGDGVWVDDIRIGGERLVPTDGPSAPAAPSNLRIAGAVVGRIDLQWQDNSTNELSFEVQRSAGGGAFSDWRTVNAGVVSTSDTGVTAGTVYAYRVRAVNDAGQSSYSNTAQVTAPTRALEAPATLTATAVSASRVDLAWVYGGTGHSGFKVERRVGSGAFAFLRTVPSSARALQDTGLAGDTLYTYRVRATDGTADSEFREASARTPESLPSAPTGLAAQAVSESRIDLSWTDASANESGFKVERRTGTSAWTLVRTVGAGTVRFSDTGLLPATRYDYRVRATNSAGDSTPAEASATTETLLRGVLTAPAAVTFGKVRVSKGKSVRMTLQNGSATERLRVTVATPSQPFSVLTGGGTTVLAPGGSHVVTLRFRPRGKGRSTGQLVLTSTDPGRGRVVVTLRGRGI